MLKQLIKYPRLSAVIALVLAGTLVWYQVFLCMPSGVLSVSMLDVGQGDAIFIETPGGNQILIDSGPTAQVIKRLHEHMSFFDTTIDMLVVTNPDKDHIGGFIEVLKQYDVGAVLVPGTISETNVSKEFDRLVQKEIDTVDVKKITARRGMDFKLDTDVHFIILFPDRDVSMLSTNEGSIVAKLVYKNTSIMLTGDSPDDIEQYLVSLNPEVLDSNILKVGHHGSKTSTSEAFLHAVSPDIALISAAQNNKYGHPHEDVVARLEKNNITVWGTYDEGTITVVSDGLIWRRE